ncbi:hypothetical protein [Sporomusa acidovorans]|uniref:2-hydroxyglutaryl-CoA dehydratase, D-component n=1 Tax=Sporomusa acidovorans (strain ATCC 49682 / DSM 3132 / Mol) TaxID=1123286 RepID=A0ABZ3IYH2_SPOA4|nr:hypothetical protein [Sporomusa acidovorans]OZC16859.1 hypothetical protein SPACI_40790 [Sporomusa acidovorans DSM 3132]SDF24536.1 Predicted nucleotide-binding protein, sugar kinase/HSP70/actin superfamily [Sporomusa acidovorans]
MKISYPHMGYLSIPVYNMLTNLGAEVIEAPSISAKTVELGSMYSPEGVCLPYKINMGNFLESMDKGADTFVTVCGAGKCRLGFYGAVQKIQLSKTKNVKFYTIDTNHLFNGLYHFLQSVAPQVSRLKIVKQLTMAIKILKALDSINNAKNFYGSRSNKPDIIIDIANKSTREFRNCQTFRDIKDKQDQIIQLIRTMSEPSACQKPKVGLVGEFYLLVEPYVNYRVEDILLQQGIEVKKFVNTGEWVYSNTLLSSLGLYNEEKVFQKQARPYLNHHIGGDGLKSVGSMLWCARNGYDGIVHIYPFGCMPEIVAQYALRNIAQDFNLPLLSLSVDEHSSDVGVLTRLEAFVDCIRRRKK